MRCFTGGAVPANGSPRTASADGDVRARPVAGCRVFPQNNWWNTDISELPRHARSDAWLRRMSPRSELHPDFGRAYGEQPVPYGIPITVVGGGHRKVNVRFHYARESDRVRYPLGTDTKIEGGRRSDGDRHAIIVDKSSASSTRPTTRASATDAGLPALARCGA